MLNFFDIRQKITAILERKGVVKQLKDNIIFKNPFQCLHFRDDRLIGIHKGYNGVTVVGKNHLLDVVFGNSSPVAQVDPWYIGLIDNTPTPVLSENDTLSSHSGWTELTAYSGNRKAWDDTNSAAKVKGTNTTSDFTMNATKTVNGIFIASAATGTSGILWATGSFDSPIDVVNTDVLKITYGLRT